MGAIRLPKEPTMTSALRRRVAAVALTLALPGGFAVLTAAPALLATTADGGLPYPEHPGGGPGSGPMLPF
jgi:hypothetical protein